MTEAALSPVQVLMNSDHGRPTMLPDTDDDGPPWTTTAALRWYLREGTIVHQCNTPPLFTEILPGNLSSPLLVTVLSTSACAHSVCQTLLRAHTHAHTDETSRRILATICIYSHL